MGRVKHAHKGAQVAPFSDHAKPLRKKKPYKVVMEMVTQEKKKLHTKMAYSVEPPRGYSFVELGDRDLTEYCREQCRKQNLVFHVVSKRGSSQLEPDTEDTRIDSQLIGHHFPFAVIEQACRFLGYVWGRRGFRKIVSGYGDDQLARSVRNAEKRLGRKATENESKEQIRTAILEVFPKVPKSDLENIVRHAFEKGTKRVGNAAGMSLARRTQLAVGAYTRHQYTDYDKLLKDPRYTWKDARNMVEPASYAKLKEWRGEGDTKELEETFREIIVLDDDESSSDEDESPSGNGRSSSLEIFSSQATGREPAPYEHIRTGPPAYGVPSRGRSPPLQPYAGSYPGHAPPAAHSVPQPVLKRTVHPYVLAPEHNDLVHRHTSRVEIVNPLRRPPPPKYFRDKDGRLYEVSSCIMARDSMSKVRLSIGRLLTFRSSSPSTSPALGLQSQNVRHRSSHCLLVMQIPT
ncbi:hypothetical protein M011DRAFT_401675 [Sporormia fimetaria CBS 119925]|uniref:DUF2293 domain-containing protein n=1 Tax=Sporormia fimetaria CBS 119925 TaxID=1340428 RepID=A0A6A6VD84_9PLEO|nr:hypothetical protein M011DRAFT_401675 [Sporormia fimetaria CBS 119925]